MANTLQHWGILGMKWGRRKARVSSGEDSSYNPSSDYSNAISIKRKKLHEMSNKEITALTTRITLERQYRELTPTKAARAKKRVEAAISTMGRITAAAGTITAFAALGKKAYDALSMSVAGKKMKRKLAAELAARLASVV